MNELYDFAKQVDVLIIFYFFIGAAIYEIVTVIMNGIRHIRDSIKNHRAKKREKKESTKE